LRRLGANSNSEDDEGYIADIPDLSHCSAFGESPEDALHEVLTVKEAWIQAARDLIRQYHLRLTVLLFTRSHNHRKNRDRGSD